MNNTEIIERMGLHDASLVALSFDGGDMRLDFKNVWINDDDEYKVTINLRGVKNIKRNDMAVKTLFMEGQYANVIDLSRSDRAVALVVDWRCFSPPMNETCSYKIDFETFDLQAEKQA